MESNSNSLAATPIATTLALPSITHHISTKLDGTNYPNWVPQLLPILRSHELMGIVDDTETCPLQDKYLLGWFTTTLSENDLSSIYGLNTLRQVWTSLAAKFASQSRSRLAYLKRQL
ncbi:hypothetical protein I3760_10G126900 [Carya illinoinensis]|nr:hypothetical protein I3760_10G126900 [Carya illinoinensis]